MNNPFKIKRGERLFAVVASLIAIAFNALMATYHFDMLSRCGKVGYWTLFSRHFQVSGFDPYSYLTLSEWKVYYTQFRHPMLSFLLYPLTQLNKWLMDLTDMNCALIIMGVLMAFFATYSAVFLRRILRELIGLRGSDSTLLTLLFFSFAYVMLVICVADHFGMSLFLLTLTLYVAGRHLHDCKPMAWWQTALLFLFSAGITLSNGVKIWLASLFTCGPRFFRPKHMLLAAVVPLLLVAGAAYWQYAGFIVPESAKWEKINEKKAKKDVKFAEKKKAQESHNESLRGKHISNEGVLSWTDISVSRTESLAENIFGEGIMLHQDYLLQDIYGKRPIFVKYRTPIPYIIGGILFLLLLAGLWAGRRSPLMWLVGSWVAFDAFIHLVLGFGLNEAYIMTAHWAFIIPLAIAWLLKSDKRYAIVLRSGLWVMAIGLFVYNAALIFSYLTD